METVKKDIFKIKSEISSYNKLKISIKNKILEKFNITIIKYISSGPGVINPEKVKIELSDIKSLIKVWVKDSNLLNNWISDLDNIERKLFKEENKKEDNLTYSFIKEEKKDEDDRKKSRDDLNQSSLENLSTMSIAPTVNKKYRSLYPESLEKLDICYLPVGVIPHYCIVYKVVGPITYVLSLTSNKKGEFFGHVIEKSRFFKGSTVVFALNQIPTSMALSMFVMPFDSKSEGNKILRECSEFLSKSVLIKLKKK